MLFNAVVINFPISTFQNFAHNAIGPLGNDHTVNGTVSPLQKPLKNLT